jgi:hypothetical protein
MSNEELLKENQELKERIELLERTIGRENSGNTGTYNKIRTMIIEKVKKEVEQDKLENGNTYDWTRKRAEKKVMSDLKWDLRVRNISDFRAEHIEQAKEYINNYTLPDEYKKSRWN